MEGAKGKILLRDDVAERIQTQAVANADSFVGRLIGDQTDCGRIIHRHLRLDENGGLMRIPERIND